MAVILLPDGTKLEINDKTETREIEVFSRGAGNQPIVLPYTTAFAVGTLLQAMSRFGVTY